MLDKVGEGSEPKIKINERQLSLPSSQYQMKPLEKSSTTASP